MPALPAGEARRYQVWQSKIVMAARMVLTFPPQPRPKQPQACTDGHLSFASPPAWMIVGTRVGLYALGLNASTARAFSSVSVGNQSGSAGLPLNKLGMTTRHGTEAARRSAPRRVGWRKPKPSKMAMMARWDDSEPVMSLMVERPCQALLIRSAMILVVSLQVSISPSVP